MIVICALRAHIRKTLAFI